MLKGIIFVLAIVTGQLMFKRVAQGIGDGADTAAMLRHIILNPWFVAATGLYASATILWVIALRDMPLSRAYLFVALAVALVPIGAAFFYHETLGPRYGIGLLLVVSGIALIGTGNVAITPSIAADDAAR